MVPVLAYWDIRGLAEQCRLLMRYLGVAFEDKRYKCCNDTSFEHNEWLEEKFSLGLDFPNLPYYVDGELKLTQSAAILEFIAEKNGMIPNCAEQCAVLRMLQNEIYDLRISFAKTCYNPEFEKLRDSFLEILPPKLKNFEEFLGEKEWLTGEKINYPDFSLCELLNQLVKFDPKCLEKFPKLQAYLSRFENLPSLKDYMASKEFKANACNGMCARWRGNN